MHSNIQERGQCDDILPSKKMKFIVFQYPNPVDVESVNTIFSLHIVDSFINNATKIASFRTDGNRRRVAYLFLAAELHDSRRLFSVEEKQYLK